MAHTAKDASSGIDCITCGKIARRQNYMIVEFHDHGDPVRSIDIGGVVESAMVVEAAVVGAAKVGV